jgi:uncharacterized protein
MKRMNLLLLVLAISVTTRAAQEDKQPPQRMIAVSGSAIGYIPADTVLWDLTLQVSGKDLIETKAASDEQVKLLTEACTKKGILVADIVVGIVKITDARLDDQGVTRDPSKPLTITRIATIRQRDTRLFSEMLEMLSRSKGVKVRYSVVGSKTDQVTKETVVKATQAAKDKATAMVTVLGARLGNVLTVNEYPPPGWNTKEESVPVDQSSSAFGVDAEKVRITVYVTFAIE